MKVVRASRRCFSLIRFASFFSAASGIKSRRSPWNRRYLPAAFVVLLSSGLSWASFSLTFQGLVRTLDTSGFSLSSPAGIVVDTSGNVFLADTGNGRILEVNIQGVASALAISGLSPSLSSPNAIAIDDTGNLYVADTGNSRVVKIDPTFAGTVVSTGAVTLSSPRGVVIDQSGNLFISDTGNNRIVKVTSGGTASALAITVSSGSSTLSTPGGLGMNSSGKLYIADTGNNRIVSVASGSSTGAVVSILGGVTLSAPRAVTVDRIGNVIIADTGNSRIAEIDTSNNGTVLFTDSQSLSSPRAMTIDVLGTVYIADTGNNRGLVVAPPVNGDLTSTDPTYSLNQSVVGFGHVQLGAGVGSTVTLTLPFTTGSAGLGGIKVLTFGAPNLDFTAGSGSTCSSSTSASTFCSVEVNFVPTAPGLRKGAVVLLDSSLRALLTIPLYGYSDSSLPALAPGVASVVSTGGAVTTNPYQIALDGIGNLYVANYTGMNVTKVPAGGGSGTVLNLGSPGGSTTQNLTGLVVDGAGNLFIGDHQNSRILVVTPGGAVSVLSIQGLSPALGFPTALALDAAGNLFIADFTGSRIVEISSLDVTGTTSSGKGTVIGTGSFSFTGSTVTGTAIDQQGDIYIAARTQNSSRIIKVSASGTASAVSIPGNITPAVSNPQGVTVDAMGNLYIVDTANNRIVKITTAGVGSVVTFSGLTSPTTIGSLTFGVTTDASGNVYVPDWSNNRIVFVNVSSATLSAFATTRAGLTSSDSPKTATVTNLGNQPITFSADPGYTADFSQPTGSTNQCLNSVSLAAGTACNVSVQFTPQTFGSLSANLPVTDDALNIPGSTQQIAVSGTATNPGDTTAIAVSTNPTGASIGQPVAVTATVTDTTSGHTSTVPTGTVSFTDAVGSTVVSLNSGNPVTLTAGSAVLTGVTLSGAGTHTITASYSGVSGTFLASSNTTTLVVSKDTATIAGPSTQPVRVTSGQAGSISVTVTGPFSVVSPPTGSLNYSILDSSNASVASGTASLTAGSNSSTATIPVAGSLAAGSYTVSITYAGDSNYLASSSPTTVLLSSGQIVPAISWTPPVTTIAVGTTLAGLLNATASDGPAAVPGTFSYTATIQGGSTVVVTGATVLAPGQYTLSATFTPADATTYSSAISSATLTVSKDTATITGPSTQPVEITAGQSSSILVTAAGHFGVVPRPTGALNYSILSSGNNSVASGSALLSVGSTNSTATIPIAGSLAAGSYTISITYAGDTNYSASATPATVQLTSGQISPSISWTPPATTIAAGATLSTTLNATASFGSTTIPGTFSYTATKQGGSAVGVTRATVLAPGQYTLVATFTPTNTATYASATASATLTVQDFVLNIPAGGANTATVSPGGTAAYALTFAPATGATFPSAVTLSVSGNPPGSTATVTPHTIPAGSGPTSVAVTIQLPSQAVAQRQNHLFTLQASALMFGMLLLPFGGAIRRTARRHERKLRLLALALVAASAMTFSACGARSGFFGSPQADYVITVTATSGSISHTTTLTLTVH